MNLIRRNNANPALNWCETLTRPSIIKSALNWCEVYNYANIEVLKY